MPSQPPDQLAITPAIVTSVRSRAGYSLEEATRYFRKIEEWEDGRASPSYRQLELMADKFKCPVALFFFPNPPDIPPVEQSFRTLPDDELTRMPRAVKTILRKGQAMQLNLAELGALAKHVRLGDLSSSAEWDECKRQRGRTSLRALRALTEPQSANRSRARPPAPYQSHGGKAEAHQAEHAGFRHSRATAAASAHALHVDVVESDVRDASITGQRDGRAAAGRRERQILERPRGAAGG